MKTIDNFDHFLLFPETINFNKINNDIAFKIKSFLEQNGDKVIDGICLWDVLTKGEVKFNSFYHFCLVVKDFMFLLKSLDQIKPGKRIFYLDHANFHKSNGVIETSLLHKHFTNAIKNGPLITAVPFIVDENVLPAFIEISDEIALSIVNRILNTLGKGKRIPTMYKRIIVITQYNKYQNELPWQLNT